jgi:hypothetical protein
MYDPGKGRWFAPDPARQYWSPYVGMGNNPVSLVDPDGRAAQLASGIAGFIIGGGLASLDIYSDPNASFSSIRSWARISTAATAGAVLAYCPATWGGFSAAVLGSGAANAADQIIKNGGTESIEYSSIITSSLGGATGYSAGSFISKSIKPGTIPYSYIARSTNIGYKYGKESLSDVLNRITLGPSILISSYTARTASDVFDAGIKHFLLKEVVIIGTPENTSPATQNVYDQMQKVAD